MRDSFVMYTDWSEQFDLLDDHQAVTLLKAIFNYQKGVDLPEMDSTTAMAFSFIRRVLDRDTEKYEKKVEQRSEAGKKSAEKRRQAKESVEQKPTKSTTVESVERESTNPTDNEHVHVDVIDSVNNNPPISPLKGWQKRSYSDNKALDTAIHDFIEYRKKGKTAFTDKAFKLAMNKLEKLAATDEEKVEIINQTIENGWSGLYEIKPRGSPKNTKVTINPEQRREYGTIGV